jgi:uncharacterized protein YpmS
VINTDYIGFYEKMVFNSTNINKINNHLSTELTEHKKDHDMTLKIQVLAWKRHKNMAGLNWLMGFQLPLLITGSPMAIHI